MTHQISLSAFIGLDNIRVDNGRYQVRLSKVEQTLGNITINDAIWYDVNDLPTTINREDNYRFIYTADKKTLLSMESEYIPGYTDADDVLTDIIRVYEDGDSSLSHLKHILSINQFIKSRGKVEVTDMRYTVGIHIGEYINRGIAVVKNLVSGTFELAREYNRSDGVVVVASPSVFSVSRLQDLSYQCTESGRFRVALTHDEAVAMGYAQTAEGYFYDPAYISLGSLSPIRSYTGEEVICDYSVNPRSFIKVIGDGDEYFCNYEYYFKFLQDKCLFFSDSKAYMTEDSLPFIEQYGYHDVTRVSKVHEDGFTVGFEIEKEDEHGRESVCANRLYNSTKWIKERDGSLDCDTGYELVSPTYNLMRDDIIDDISASQDLRRLIDSDYTTNCGGHIHIGHTDMSGELFFNAFSSWIPMFYSLYVRRINKEHCRIKKNEDIIREREHYQSVIIYDDRIELRIPSAVPNVRTLTWRIELLRYMCDNLNASPIKIAQDMLNRKSKLNRIMAKQYDQNGIVEKLRLYTFFANRLLNFEGGKIKEENLDYSLFTNSEINLLKRRGIYE